MRSEPGRPGRPSTPVLRKERPLGRSVPRMGIVLLSALLASNLGCGNGASSSTTEGTVSGLVTLMGKPIAGGTLQFNPANSARPTEGPRTTEIGPDGRYSIKTLVGGNVVTPLLPKIGRKGDVRRAQKSIEVTSGENTLDIDIPEFKAPPKP